MIVWDVGYLRKIRAVEIEVGDPVRSLREMPSSPRGLRKSRPLQLSKTGCTASTVAEDHTLVANGIFTGQCDGDEDCVMLLMDGLLNFSKSFLPQNRGRDDGCAACAHQPDRSIGDR